jgi:hypothetical protein
MRRTLQRLVFAILVTLSVFALSTEQPAALSRCDLCSMANSCDEACYDYGAGDWGTCGSYGVCNEQICGDDYCWRGHEDYNSCPADCNCGNGACEVEDFEDNSWCPSDCYCGDGTCLGDEYGPFNPCLQDCPAYNTGCTPYTGAGCGSTQPSGPSCSLNQYCDQNNPCCAGVCYGVYHDVYHPEYGYSGVCYG